MLILAAGTKKVAGADTYLVQRSLRFRQSATAYLSRTPSATATSNTKFTWSGWVKRGLLSQIKLFGASTSATNVWYAQITDNVTDALTFGFYNGGNAVQVTTTQLFRDTSSWYHIVIAVDTTQATASNRVLIYINGVQVTSFATATYPTLSQTMLINASTIANYIGTAQGTIGTYDGYMSEVYMIDGQALTPSSFGATNADTGVWRAKAYTGTYGTNGFYLPFTDNSALTTSSNVGLGRDYSGNANYWVTNNISITAGTTYDSMTDVPTNTSETAGNYCTLNPLNKNASLTPTDGNLNVNIGVNNTSMFATMGMTSGKWYWEVTCTSISATAVGLGIATSAQGTSTPIAGLYSWQYYGNGQKYNNSAGTAYGAAYATGNVIGIAFDASAGSLTFYKNNTSQGVAYSSLASDTYFPYFGGFATAASTIGVNFGQRPFTYTPPTGYVALNTYNLPSSTILQGNKYMDATTYTGTGATLSVTNAAAFKPDFVWIKGRSGATDHALYDFVRGTTKDLLSNSTAAETTQATGLTAFNTNGFTVGALAKINTSAATYVGWQWVGSAGSVSNTAGSITSTVDANTTAGFSIVTYTGNGTAGATIGHALGVAPKMIIVKDRVNGTNDWVVYHGSLTNTTYVFLNSTAAANTVNGNLLWNSTSPTSSLITLGTSGRTNGSADTYVAYCFAEIAGFSKFGSYTGNGSTDGTFVYTGFRPKYVMIKNTSGLGNWSLFDTSRSPTNGAILILEANSTQPDQTYVPLDILSNGFKPRTTQAEANTSSSTYIYMAFAENPFKNANAR